MKLTPKIQSGKSEADITKEMNDLYWSFHWKFYGRKPTDFALLTDSDNIKSAYKRMLHNVNDPIPL